MSGWAFQALSPTSGQVELHPLPLAAGGGRCRLRLRSLPGSNGLHLPCAFEGTVRRRFEVPAAEAEAVALDLELDARGELHAASENRSVLVLPPDERFAPPPPAWHPAHGQTHELLFVIDGTARRSDGADHPLLVGSDRWPEVIAKLVEIARELGAAKEAHLGLVAFGDEALPMLDAADLEPRYRLWPSAAEQGNLPRFEPSELAAWLEAVPPSSGGDFVDALADALALCAGLPRSERRRRIVVVVGDSPGHSLADPAPDGADLLPRAQEIEGPLARLHTLGALVVTIFNDPGLATDPAWALRPDLPAHARRQYEGMASTRALAFTLQDLDPRRVAQAVKSVPEVLGFGCCYGVVEGAVGEGAAVGE